MAEKIIKGYLINTHDYNVFDSIITILNDQNEKIVCYAPGVRKISSKNGRLMQFGSFLEFEIFHSIDKMSKLKKINLLSELDFEYSNFISIHIMNDLIKNNNNLKINLFDLYQRNIINILKFKDDLIVAILLLINYLHLLEIEIDFNNCQCKENMNIKTVDIESLNSMCDFCYDKEYRINTSVFNTWKIFDLYIKNDFDSNILPEVVENKVYFNIIKILSIIIYKHFKVYTLTVKHNFQ